VVSNTDQWKDRIGLEFLTPDHVSAALFTAALLSRRKERNARLRSQIISAVPPFDIYVHSAISDGLAYAFQGTTARFSPRGLTANAISWAAEKAMRWLESGIFLIPGHELTSPNAAFHGLPPVLFAKGDRSLLHVPAAAILNSRKSRRVTPQDHWVIRTKELVQRALKGGLVIASGYGNLPYALVAFLAKGFPVILACDDVLPFMDAQTKLSQFLSTYGDLLLREQTLLISSFPPGRMPPQSARLVERDHLVAALSSLLMIGEVRPGGNMASILEVASRRKIEIIGAPTDRDRDCKKSKAENVVMNKRVPHNRRQETDRASAGLKEEGWPGFSEFREKSSFLIHYTRSCPGPWPGQTVEQYCRSLIDGAAESGHTALDTLQRILGEKLIRASHRLTRGPYRVVSLTECLPDELSTIIQWRPGLIRWNFEPFGIGFRKEALIELGAMKVIYGMENTLQQLQEDRKYLFQIRKRDGKDWTVEKEWRLLGDLLLGRIRLEDIVVIVPGPHEARIIAERFSYRVALTGNGKCQRSSAFGTAK
jgi:hypothetical protein